MKKSLLGLILCACCLSVYADTITWLTFNRPPWFMADGRGYGDRMQARYVALLPQYQHKSVVGNLARMKAEMEKGGNFCISALADLPVYRQYMHMSKGIYVLPRPKIFMRQDTHLKMGRPSILSIKELADNTSYQMGIIRGATYLPIDLHEYEGSRHSTVISSSSPIVSIMQMIDLGRIDWAADYPHIVQWGATSGDIQVDGAFAMVDIKEFENSNVLRSGIACTKNSWGRGIIHKLNDVVDKEIMLDFRDWVSWWMPPGHVKEEFIRLNQTEFGF